MITRDYKLMGDHDYLKLHFSQLVLTLSVYSFV